VTPRVYDDPELLCSTIFMTFCLKMANLVLSSSELKVLKLSFLNAEKSLFIFSSSGVVVGD